MKKSIILLLVLIIVAIMASCSKDDPLRLKEFAYIDFNGAIPSTLTSKTFVPDCSEGTPTQVEMAFQDVNDAVWRKTSKINISNEGVITTIEEMDLPVGDYQVIEILLTDGNNTLYAVPSEEDKKVVGFADIIVPFPISVQDDLTINGTVFCAKRFDPPADAEIRTGIETMELESFWVNIQAPCVDRITFEIDGQVITEYQVEELGYYEFLIPKGVNEQDFHAFSNGNLIYGLHGVFDGSEILRVDPVCN